MAEKNIRKSITVTLKIKDIDGIEKVPESDRYQSIGLTLRKKYGDFSGKIHIAKDTEDVIIKWYPLKVDAKAEFFHKKAITYAKNKDFYKAIESWSEAININSHDPDYYYNLGVVYFEIKKYQDSIEKFRQAITICPFYYRAYFILGIVYLKQRKFELAEKYIRESIVFNPQNALAYLNLGAVYSILKNYDEGIRMFKKASELSPQEARAYLGLAKIYSIKNEIEKANECFVKVIELDKKGDLANYAKRAIVSTRQVPRNDVSEEIQASAEEFYSEGYRYYIGGDYLKAETMYREYLSLKPQDDFVWSALGEAQLRAGKVEQATASFNKAISIHPKGQYYKELAIALDMSNKSEEVLAAVNKAQVFGKEDSIIYYLGGKNLIREGKYKDGIVMLEQALKLNKNNFAARYTLALALEKTGQIDLAIEHLEEIRTVKINTPLKEKAEQLLNKLSRVS